MNSNYNVFDTRVMIRMLEQMYQPRTFFRDTFFQNRVNAESEYVDIDIRKGKRRIAPFVARKIGHTIVERLDFTTQSVKPELIAPMMITTAEDVVKRSAGESIYGAKSPNARMGEILGRDMRDMSDMITRAEEWMCSQVLYNGKIVMNVEGEGTREIDFSDEWHFDKVDWEDVKRSSPNRDFRNWKRAVSKWSGLNPDVAIVGANALEWLYLSEEWRDEQKFFQTNFANYEPKLMQDGITFVGYIPSIGLELYTYDEWSIDPSDNLEKPLADPDKIVIGCTQAYTSLIYGMIYDVAIGSFAAPRVPKSFIRDEPSARFLKLSSAPVAVPHQIDAFLTVTACTRAPTEQERVNIVAAQKDIIKELPSGNKKVAP